MINLKELSKNKPRFFSGHRACAGCGAAICARQVMITCGSQNVIVGLATGCLEVFSTLFPYTSWNCPVIHNAFENVAATISGAERAYKALKKRRRLRKTFNFIAIAGDGGSYDIGLQSLSGFLERGHDILYICYDNGAYSNTGFQRSSATPFCAETTTEPWGKKGKGKLSSRKNLTEIVAAHNVSYVAQTAVGFHNDLITKVQKALSLKGPRFINILSPCVLGWGIDPSSTIEVAQKAVLTRFWPLYEIEDGIYKINFIPSKKTPLVEFLKLQKRFGHLLKPENQNLLKELEIIIEKDWQKLLKKVECSQEK